MVRLRTHHGQAQQFLHCPLPPNETSFTNVSQLPESPGIRFQHAQLVTSIQEAAPKLQQATNPTAVNCDDTVDHEPVALSLGKMAIRFKPKISKEEASLLDPASDWQGVC